MLRHRVELSLFGLLLPLTLSAQSGSWSTIGGCTDFGRSDRIRAIEMLSDGRVAMGGSFDQCNSIPAENVVLYSPGTNTWSSLGAGTGPIVTAIAISGQDLYVGGIFSTAGGESLRAIARWNSLSGNWSSLGSGLSLNSQVSALEVTGTDLYVAGSFSTIGNPLVGGIGRWSLIGGAWNEVAGRPNGLIEALAASGSNIYVGGDFTVAGGQVVNHIARLNTAAGNWSSLGTGIIGRVEAIAVSGPDVYVGGVFNSAGGQAASNVARWNSTTSTWSPLGAGVSGGNNLVNAITVVGSDVYVGGDFTLAGGQPANGIARWSSVTASWSSLGTGLGATPPLRGVADAIAQVGNGIYVGGSFTFAGGLPVANVARWSLGSTSVIFKDGFDGTAPTVEF